MAKKTTSTSGSSRTPRRSAPRAKPAAGAANDTPDKAKATDTGAEAKETTNPIESVEVEVTDREAPESRRSQANALIENKVLWSLGAGVIPIPLVDLASIAAVQVKLIRQLSELYSTTFSEDRTKKIIGVLTASVGTGVLATGATASALKVIPGVGSVAGGVALPLVAGASTYALGQVFLNHFEEGGSVLDFEQEKAKEFFKKAYTEGEKVAVDLKNKVKSAF